MKPLKYIISSVYLYDNQLKFDYLLLHNEDRLPYLLSQKLNQIYHDPEWILLKSNKERIQELLEINDITAIKATDYIELVKVRDTHIPIYKAYDIYWDEAKSGINLFQWSRAEVWNKAPTVWTMRIDEYKENRIKEIRNNLIEELI